MSYLRSSLRVSIRKHNITRGDDTRTRDPHPTDTVRDALDKMNAGHFLDTCRSLPRSASVGIISVRDLYQSVVDQMSTDIILLAEGLLQG